MSSRYESYLKNLHQGSKRFTYIELCFANLHKAASFTTQKATQCGRLYHLYLIWRWLTVPWARSVQSEGFAIQLSPPTPPPRGQVVVLLAALNFAARSVTYQIFEIEVSQILRDRSSPGDLFQETDDQLNPLAQTFETTAKGSNGSRQKCKNAKPLIQQLQGN